MVGCLRIHTKFSDAAAESGIDPMYVLNNYGFINCPMVSMLAAKRRREESGEAGVEALPVSCKATGGSNVVKDKMLLFFFLGCQQRICMDERACLVFRLHRPQQPP